MVVGYPVGLRAQYGVQGRVTSVTMEMNVYCSLAHVIWVREAADKEKRRPFVNDSSQVPGGRKGDTR